MTPAGSDAFIRHRTESGERRKQQSSHLTRVTAGCRLRAYVDDALVYSQSLTLRQGRKATITRSVSLSAGCRVRASGTGTRIVNFLALVRSKEDRFGRSKRNPRTTTSHSCAVSGTRVARLPRHATVRWHVRTARTHAVVALKADQQGSPTLPRSWSPVRSLQSRKRHRKSWERF